MIEVFPEAQEFMHNSYDSNAVSLIEKFGMHNLADKKAMADAEAGIAAQPPLPPPVTYSFYFDEARVNAWLDNEMRSYENIERMYEAEV